MSSLKNLEIAKTSFLNKSNSSFIEEMYLKFIEKDPSLPLSWEIYFKSLGEELSSVVKELEGPTWKPNKKKIKINIQQHEKESDIDLKNRLCLSLEIYLKKNLEESLIIYLETLLDKNKLRRLSL